MKNLVSFAKKYLSYSVITLAAVIFTLLSLTGNLTMSNQLLIENITIAIVLAVSLSMVVGFLGELSLGHAGFMCVGAFVGGKFAAMLEPVLGNGVPLLLLSMIVGSLAAALCGIIIGLPALRLRGDYLAIVTLAFGEIVRSIFMNVPESLFGGKLGLETPRFPRKYLFIFGFLAVLACLAVTQNLIKSKHGRAITSIRDNEIAARAMGIDVTKYKLTVFTISAFFAGLAGVLFSYTQNQLQSPTFDYNYSIEILVMVVLGGMGSINGSIVAAALVTFLTFTFQKYLTGNLAVLQNLFYALILIVIVIYKNAPGLKYFREKYNLRTIFSKKKKEAATDAKED